MKIFPVGIAYGSSFYDRIEERKKLRQLLESNQHTTIIAPRRFGKTSLIRKVIDEHNYPHIWVDLMAFTDKTEATNQIVKHIGDLVIKIGRTEAKIKGILKKFLNYLKPELSLDIASEFKLSLNFASSKTESPPDITKALMTLDDIAQYMDVRVIFVFDEFQEIVALEKNNNAFQGAIRHAVERSQNATYIFSGSKHETLKRLFTGKKNPLYELCNLMSLELISEAYYQEYLTSEFEKRWKNTVDHSVIGRILHHTKCYPKYVNALCLSLWASDKKPDVDMVDLYWQDFMFSRKSSIREELNSLKMSDRKLLRSLCFQATKEPTSLEYSQHSLLPTSTTGRSLRALMTNDFIYIDQAGFYRPIDPTYRAYFELFG